MMVISRRRCPGTVKKLTEKREARAECRVQSSCFDISLAVDFILFRRFHVTEVYVYE